MAFLADWGSSSAASRLRFAVAGKKHPPARRPDSDIKVKSAPRAGIPRRHERDRLMAGDAELEMAMRPAALRECAHAQVPAPDRRAAISQGGPACPADSKHLAESIDNPREAGRM